MLLYWLGTSGWYLSLVCAPLPCESMACLLFMRLPWPEGLSGLCCTFCYSFLTFCGVDESLGLRSLYPASSVGWVLLWHGPFLLQSSPCLLCELADNPAILPHCLCHVASWLMLPGPPLDLPCTFLLLSSCSPVLLLGLFSYNFGLPWPVLFLWAFSARFIPLGIFGSF